jgi:hypothetical protein
MIRLLWEATFVGAMLALLLVPSMRLVNPRTTQGLLLLGFVLGVFIHLVCEVTGINKYYCSQGYACLQR